MLALCVCLFAAGGIGILVALHIHRADRELAAAEWRAKNACPETWTSMQHAGIHLCERQDGHAGAHECACGDSLFPPTLKPTTEES